MEITSQAIEQYLTRLYGQEDPILVEMEERAKKEGFPIVGPLVGRILYQLVKISGARRVLELGSGFGYSGYWFSQALGKSGEITLTEFSEENIRAARDFFKKGKVETPVHFYHGDALELLENLPGPYDIIFNDVNKPQYPEIFRKAPSRLRPGGLLISDNVLWKGLVVESDGDEKTNGILEYTHLIFSSPDFYSSIIPVRDGISVSIKRF
ncbi:MAG: O-methyltransferase [Acidobacteria bacterium]|nr:O-methyltransferase [Acidobacteriota bacterium]